MSDFKEYRSVTEFPAKPENLSYQELIANYYDLRNTYKSLTCSRGQLVRRQREAKSKIVVLNQEIQEKIAKLAALEQEKQAIQRILERRNFELQQKDIQKQEIQQEFNQIQTEVNGLKEERREIAKLIQNLQNTYQEVQGTSGIVGTFERLQKIMRSVRILLTTDVNELVKQQNSEASLNPENGESPKNIGRKLLDDK